MIQLPRDYPMMLDGAFPSINRRNFTVYSISSPSHDPHDLTQVHCYTTGTISLVGGVACFTISRKQFAYILFQARANRYQIKRTTWLDDNLSRVTTWAENGTITSLVRE